MSRDLLVIGVIAIVCLIISPFYKEYRPPAITRAVINAKKLEDTEPPDLFAGKNATVAASKTKRVVFMCDTFLPGSFAGSEISAYETAKYLRDRGHTVDIIVDKPKAAEYNGLKLHKYNPTNDECLALIQNSDAILFQMEDKHYNFELLKKYNKTMYLSIHIMTGYEWILTQKVSFPVVVIYNSRMTQDLLPTIHDNLRMIPYVNVKRFNELRSYTVHNDVVCLINCNENKGALQFNEMVKRMKHVKFIGVKGGYANQKLLEPCPENLVYMENQKDVRVVFKKVGILVMPSKKETWGRTAVEAMAAGVPVIHSEAGGLVECLGGAGILCQRDDIDAWCEAIDRIIRDKQYHEMLRQNGFERIKDIEVEQNQGRQELAMKIEA
jgi:glycosyltransferase involved in cell wall biosynthesis